MSTASGSSGTGGETWTWLPDMLDPVLVAVELTSHRRLEQLLDLAGDRTGLAVAANHPVVDRANRHDLGCRPGQERLLGRVQVGTQDVADLNVVPEVSGDGQHGALGNALQSTGGQRRGDQPAALDHKDVLSRALAHVALGGKKNRLVVAGFQGL